MNAQIETNETNAADEGQNNGQNGSQTRSKPAAPTLDDMRTVIRIEDKLEEAVQPILDSIRAHAQKMTQAKNAADTGSMERGALWNDTLRIVELLAPEVAKTPRIAEWAFNELVRPVMPEDGEGRGNTVKTYMSTGRNVLVKLVLGEGRTVEALKEKSYADVRKMLRPATNQVADQMRDTAIERIRFIAKNGDKFGTEGEEEGSVFTSESRLTAILEAIEPHYNAVRSAKDSSSAAARGAAELESNRQQAPTEAGTVETVAKPEAPRRAA